MFPLLEVTRGQNTQLTVSAFSSIDGLLSNGLMTLRWSTAAEMCGWSGSRCKNAEDYAEINLLIGSATTSNRTTSLPALSKLDAICPPMLPKPMNPTLEET